MRDPAGEDQAGTETGAESTTDTPRWVKVFGLVAAIIVVLLVLIALLAGGHGPGRHTQSWPPGTGTPPFSAAMPGTQWP
jgi:hypothetical protein